MYYVYIYMCSSNGVYMDMNQQTWLAVSPCRIRWGFNKPKPDAPWCWKIYLQYWAIFGVNVTMEHRNMEDLATKNITIPVENSGKTTKKIRRYTQWGYKSPQAEHRTPPNSSWIWLWTWGIRYTWLWTWGIRYTRQSLNLASYLELRYCLIIYIYVTCILSIFRI